MLPNGKVLIAGGFDPSIGGEFASAELYDPASGQFSYTGNMSIARTMHVACPLPGGRVLVAGALRRRIHRATPPVRKSTIRRRVNSLPPAA